MGFKYKISIVIPTFNVERYVSNAIDSLLIQTFGFKNLEVIIVDDCSTDNTRNLILDYAEKYNNIIPIFFESNSGSAGKPRNVGIQLVSSDYVMFLDPDDEFSEDYCEIMYDAINNNDFDIVKCNYMIIKNNNEYPIYYFDKKIDYKIIRCSDEPLRNVAIWRGIHKSSLVKNIQFPQTWGEDIYFSIKEHLIMDKMLYLNNYCGYRYYNRDDSHAKSPDSLKIYGLIHTFNKSKELCINHNRYDVINIVLGQQMDALFLRISNNSDPLKCKIKLLNEIYEFEKDIPNFFVRSRGYKIVNLLLLRKFFYLTLFSLKIISSFYKSNIFSKIVAKFT